MDSTNISISITEGQERLIISGPISLYQKFLATLEKCNGEPDPLSGTSIHKNVPASKSKAENKAPARA